MYSPVCLENQQFVDDKFDTYKKWVISTYGDGSKTKTITWAKYLRIHKVLMGRSLGESPKFKFWVKSKDFVFLSCNKQSGRPSEMSGYIIALPNKKTSTERVYKRVAVVEEFFDIIYDIHVNIEGRSGKHAGQKRTYRKIIESYAFLPREAVTHFLMNCKDCRGPSSPISMRVLDSSSSPASTLSDSMVIDLSLSKMSAGDNQNDSETTTATTEVKDVKSVDTTSNSAATDSKVYENSLNESKDAVLPKAEHETQIDEEIVIDEKTKMDDEQGSRGVVPTMPPLSTALKRSAPSYTMSPNTSKKSSDEADDDDEDDDEEKLSNQGNEIDPERLKAFNMFCRLFVDENLDRLVPISKQPKDKVQAILDACDRQFPEFHDRARKRIRTYLKSCRRMRRAKEMNGWDNFRPTPPHLTSPIAESLLSQACENETQNSKRMRMGLEPIIANPPSKASNQISSSSHSHKTHVSAAGTAVSLSSHIPSSSAQISNQPPHRMFADWRFQQTPAFRPELTPFFTNSFFRPPGFPGFPAPLPAAATLQASQVANQLVFPQSQDGFKGASSAELSLKKAVASSSSTSNKTSTLSTAEIATIRQLISGYRESATFLYRSADELEQLIAQNN